jgi:lactoylglutathione lyase
MAPQEEAMSKPRKARAVGINHVALEVGDIEEALEFYGRFLDFKLRSRSATMAFIDLGDQFIALSKADERPRDGKRHFGLVVDDKEAVKRALDHMGVEIVSGRFLDFYDPWGNRVEIVGYQGIQFTKADNVLRGMDLVDLGKTDDAIRQLADKGMAPR